MKKKGKKRNLRIKATAIKRPMAIREPEAQYTLPQLAKLAMKAEKELTPLIRADNMDTTQALALIVMRMNTFAWGEDHAMTTSEIAGFAGIILACWKEGLFTPSEEFPYTLDQMLAHWEDELPDINRFKRQVDTL
jgi:hypothetical protein